MPRRTPSRDAKGRFVSKGRNSQRRRNPETTLLDEPVMPLVVKGTGLAAGGLVGFLLANLVNDKMLAKLSGPVRGIGLAVTAFFGLLGGAKIQKMEQAKKLPIEAATFGAVLPLAYKALGAFGLPIFGAPAGVAGTPTANTLPITTATAGARRMFQQQNRASRGLIPMQGMYQTSGIPGSYNMSGALQMAHTIHSEATL